MWDTLVNELTQNFSQVPLVLAFTRLVMAALLAGIVGYERERRAKPAGLRTHILVSMAACLFMIISLEMASVDFGGGEDVSTQIDPLRLIEAVTAGVAFLAAGLIFTSGGRVVNVTTGASLWLAGAVGLSCGAGQIPLAALSAVTVVVTLWAIGKVERAVGTHPEPPDEDAGD